MTELIFRFRWLIITLCMLMGVFSSLLIPRIETDPDIRNYIPESFHSKTETDKIEKEFGVQDLAMIIFSDSTMIDNENLMQVRNIDRVVSRISGVSDRISPFTVMAIKSEEGMMTVKPLIGLLPLDKGSLENLEDEIHHNSFADGIVFSSDLTTASITVTIRGDIPEKQTLLKIDSVISRNPGRTNILRGGLPYLRQSLMSDVNTDAMILIPAALIVMLTILRLNMGNWRSVFLPFGVVVLTTAFSMAIMPVAGWKMSIIILLVPVILIAVANNYGIYLIARFQEIAASDRNLSDKEIVRLLLRSLNMPVMFSGFTTIAGLLGLMLHDVIPARQVGILSAAGISLALLLSLILIPAVILVGGRNALMRKDRRNSSGRLDALLTRLTGFIINRKGTILIITLVVVLSFAAGIPLVKISTNQENYFPDKHSVRQASDIINSKFGGSQTISIMIEGDILNPAMMKGIDSLTCSLSGINGVGDVYSISQLIREMSKAIYIKAEDGYNMIPETREGIAQMFELYNMSGSPDDFNSLLDLDYSKAHVMVRLSEPENHVIRNVLSETARISGFIRGKVTIGGYALIMADLANSLIRGQISSLLFAVLTVFLLLMLIFRSLKGGIIGIIPLIASVIILFGFMGYSGIAIDAATALLSSIMIGVGVDFTIQLMWCFRAEAEKGLSGQDALSAAMSKIGRSIIINAFCVMAGFAVLVCSGFTSIRFFGYLVVICIGSCLAGALIIIPSVLLQIIPSFNGRKTYKK